MAGSKPAEDMIDKDEFRVIRRRQQLEDLLDGHGGLIQLQAVLLQQLFITQDFGPSYPRRRLNPHP